MAGKGMRPKRGYNLKKWYENFSDINWTAKKPVKKCKCTECKCKKSNQMSEDDANKRCNGA